MYLKEIRAVGFKSFAEKTILELDKGITGIVGPNGSGKSNVVDAIRWVLGEQSIKELRGENGMSDIIFSGSKNRNKLNSASVTLVFDNTDKYLSSKYSELAIKRRVHSSGENEYFINNVKCRLKDIINLFIDSGASKGSYNIISQGKVGEIVSNKPSERRVIFEEAAGVLKYKSRKMEAIKKLDRTHDNLDRINDIITELKNQVEPLKIQRDKAVKYVSLKDELENIEVAVLATDIKKMSLENEEYEKEIDEINQSIISLDTDSNVNEVNLDLKKENVCKIEIEINENQEELINLTSLAQKLEGDKKITLERKQYDVDDMKLHNNVLALKESKLVLENSINLINEDLVSKETELKNVKNNIFNEEEKQNKIKKDKQYALDSLSRNTRKETELSQKIKILENQIENNSLYPKGVKSVIENSSLEGIYDVIANLIEMDKKYITAISTSLGAAANFLVCEDDTSAKKAINYLKEKRLGRATFFPVQVIKRRDIDSNVLNKVKDVKGFVGIASNLVTYSPKFANIISNQLGSVIITSDLDSANLISKKVNHYYKIVTLDGDVVHVGGSLTGGNKISFKGVMSEQLEIENSKNERKKVINEIKKKEEEINAFDIKLKEYEDKLNKLNREEVIITEFLNSKKNQIALEEQKLETVSNEMAGIDNIINDNFSEEEDKILKEYYEVINKKEKVKKIIDTLKRELDEKKDEIQNEEFDLRKNNTEFNKKQQELKEKEINKSKNEIKIDNFLNVLSEEYSMTYEKAEANYFLSMPYSEARLKVNELKKDIKVLGMVNVASIEEYDRVNTRYEFLSNQREDLYKAETTLLEIISDMDKIMSIEFSKTFKEIKIQFEQTFKELFGGGEAKLELTEPDNLLETGVEIIAQPPGKKLQHLTLLSGGEKTLTAISLLFAILKTKPVPFAILDEVEAALDEANVDNFGYYLNKFKEKTQFIVITHKKKTMEFVDTLYGITMQESGVSKLVSVKLKEIEDYK